MNSARCGFLSKALLATYVLAAALLPFSHHDVICHLKSSTHCTSCVVSSSAETASGTAAVVTARLTDAGHAIAPGAPSVCSVAISPSFGRAPPALD